MSATKLTLKLEKTAISRAKIFAETKETSVSKLVEEYFYSLVPQKSGRIRRPISPLVKKLSGIVQAKDFDYKKELETALRDKYKL